MSQSRVISDAIDYTETIARIKDIFNASSPMEQQQFLKIVEELSDKGYSQTLEQIYLADFKEVPVSIDRFLTDPYYLGSSNDCGRQIYPGWWDAYHAVFGPGNEIYEVVLTGATRLGKSSSAVSMMCYMTYLLMCYRNPQKYFGLKEISRATIAFANLTKDLAVGVAYREYHDTLITSPWFMDHGTKNSSATKPLYIPEGNQIEIVAASDSAHLLGMQLWACLVGDTEVITDRGVRKLQDLEDQTVDVLQFDPNSGETYYVTAEVKLTKHVSETIRIELEDGSVFEGTPDHRVMLSDGTYKRLDELTENDDILEVYSC